MIFHCNCRENHEELDRTSIESEVFDIDLGGNDEGDNANEDTSRIGEDVAPTTSVSGSALVTSQVATNKFGEIK